MYLLVQFSYSVMSKSLWPQGLQHTRGLLCPSLPPGVCSNSCSLNQYCHSTISSSVTPFSSCPQSFPASGLFPNEVHLHIRWPSLGASAWASVLPMNVQGWFPWGLTGLIPSLQGTLKSLLQHNSKASILWSSTFFMAQVSHPYMMSTTNWQPRALSVTEQQGHFPSASVETEPCAAVAVDLQHPLGEFRMEWGTLCFRKSSGTGL